jgi:hypothetical protein
MGFYIHSCPKMRYKADYAPCDLLCPQALAWVRLDAAVVAALEQHKYVELCSVAGVQVGCGAAWLGVVARDSGGCGDGSSAGCGGA